MRFRNGTRVLALAITLAAMFALSTGSALAQDYPPLPDEEAVQETVAEADEVKGAISQGDIQTIVCENLLTGSDAHLTVNSPGGEASIVDGVWVAGSHAIHMTRTVAANGTAVFEFRIPEHWPDGTANWTVEGIDADGNPVTLSGSFIIDQSLPITGAGISRMALSAGVLLVFGTALVLIARRRRTGVPAAS